jgi:hypothetical protein
MRPTALLTVLLLAACDRPAALRMDGLGAAKIGTPLAEVEAALGPLVMPSGVEPDSCFTARSGKYPGVLVMMMEGVLQRIDVRDGAMATATGVRIGDTADKVRKIYGDDVTELPHKYEWESGAKYLTVFTPDKSLAMRFTTTGDQKVARFQAGKAEPVQLVEGCG